MKLKAILSYAVILLSASTLNAEGIAVVDWSGLYDTGSRSLALPSPTDNGGTRTYEFSATNSIVPSSNYQPPSGKSNLFFGVLQNHQINGTPANFGSAFVSPGDVNSTIRIQGGSGDSSISGMIFFQKSGFLNGFESGSLALSELDASFNISDHAATSTTFRFSVQNGTNWYLSESAYTTNGNGTFSQEDLGSIQWGSWDPTGAPINSAPTSFDTLGSSLTDVQSFGFYFNLERDTTTPRFRVDSYTVTAIPEPGTLALVGIALGSLLLLRRRK
jgi:hypothetical protein